MPQVQSLPQLASLPIDEPIGLPKASPGEFASPGATVSELGRETAQLALGNQAFNEHLAEAQRYLNVKQIEINVQRMESEAHDSLSKAVTPEDAQAVHTQFTTDVNNELSKHVDDQVLARQLNLYGQQADIQMQSTVNARKATIIQHSDNAANKTFYKSSVSDAVNATMSGGDGQAELAKLDAKLQSSVHVLGTMLPDEAAAIMENAYKDVDKGVIKAKTNSPDPLVRQKNIEQLKSGQGYEHLDDADISGFLTAAEKRDRELSNLADSENLNAVITQANELTDGMSYEGKVNAYQSDKWLKANGVVDENGLPNHKLANKVLEEFDRQEQRANKIQTEKDSTVINKYYDAANTGKLTVPQIDKVVRDEGGSAKAANILKSDLNQFISRRQSDYRFAEFVAGAGARKDNREARISGGRLSADYFRQLTNGETVDMNTVWDKVDAGDMTTSQARQVEAHMNALKDKNYQYNSIRINNATGLSDAAKTKMQLDLLNAKTQENLQGNAMVQWTDKVIDDTSKKQTTNYIEQWFGNLKEGRNIWEKPPAKPTIAPKGGIEQKSPSTGQYRHSTDGGKTWQPGQLPR